MAYIAPNSTIEIFGDISLSAGQEDTLYFSSTSAKDSYFSGITKLMTLSSQSYTRKDRGYIRVEATMTQLYNACYMRFKNTSFENKWFYAFILSVNYVNNITVEIQFEIDVMMTWMGAFTLAQCFIERQHVTDDAIGHNIVEENLDIGDYVYNSITRTNALGDYTIIIGASVDQSGKPVAGGTMVNNIYSGIELHQFGTVAAANSFIDQLTDKAKSDAIVACVMCPSKFITDQTAVTEIITTSKNYTYIDGYQPKNNKLFTYPYNYLVVTNGQGNYATFRYEFWVASNDCRFSLGGVAGLQPCAILTPDQYKHSAENLFNYSESMTLNNFPQCAFNIDQYKAFLAQNSASIAVDAVSTVGSGILNTVSGFATLGLNGGLQKGIEAGVKIANTLAFHSDYKKKPPQSNGVTTTDFDASRREKDFWFLKQSITRQYAKVIDDYFTMYGYAIHEVATPNMNARPYYTYVKTVDAVVHGNIPSDDCRVIEDLFNRGTRFWKNHTQIGNYSLNNAPT